MTDSLIAGLAPGQRHAAVKVIDLAPLLVDEATAAKLLNVSSRTVFTLAADGKLPSIKIGSRKLYSVESLRKFVASSEAESVAK